MKIKKKLKRERKEKEENELRQELLYYSYLKEELMLYIP